MTHTPGTEAELRAKIKGSLEYHLGFNDERDTHNEGLDDVMQLIEADRQRIEAESRLDEVSNFKEPIEQGAPWAYYITRKATLTSQLKGEDK